MSESVTGVGKNLRTKVRLQNMPVVAKVDEKTIWYRWCLCLKICIQTVTTCCTVYRSLRTPETVAKCYLKSIDTTIVKEMNEILYPNVPEYVRPYNPATEIFVMPLQFEGWVGTRNKLGTIPPNVGLIWVLKFLIALSNFKPFSTVYIDTFVPSKTILEKIIVKYGSAQLLTYLIKCPPDIRRVDTPHHFWNFWKSDFSRQNHIYLCFRTQNLPYIIYEN